MFCKEAPVRSIFFIDIADLALFFLLYSRTAHFTFHTHEDRFPGVFPVSPQQQSDVAVAHAPHSARRDNKGDESYGYQQDLSQALV